MTNNTNNTNSLQVTSLHNQLSFVEWNQTIHLTLHEQGRMRYITNNYTAIVQAVDDYNAAHTAILFESLSITMTISITSDSISGEKSSLVKAKMVDTKQKQIAALLSNSTALKSACELCKGHHKVFIFICSMVVLELLKDISGMSDGCPLALWTAINNHYRNNDVALQTARCDLSNPEIYLIRPSDTVHSVWAHIQALINMLTTKTKGHKMLERSQLIILATALKNVNPTFKVQFNVLADDTSTENLRSFKMRGRK